MELPPLRSALEVPPSATRFHQAACQLATSDQFAEENGMGSEEERTQGLTAQVSPALGLLVAHQKPCGYTTHSDGEV